MMEIVSDGLNGLAIIAGGLMYMIYGGVYYSILLGKKKNKQTEGPFKYIFAAAVAFISSYLTGMIILLAGTGVWTGLAVGFIIGLIITLVYCKNFLFGLMPKKSLLIAIGDHLVIFTLLGLLHGIMS